MLTKSDMHNILAKCRYKPGWSILLNFSEDKPFIQMSVSVESDASLDSVKRDGTRTPWKSGKRYLSYHMCRQEVVGAVWGLIQDAEMHEAREWFRYDGASIYNPHLDPDVLAEVARKASSFNVRDNAMTMDEQPTFGGKVIGERPTHPGDWTPEDKAINWVVGAGPDGKPAFWSGYEPGSRARLFFIEFGRYQGRDIYFLNPNQFGNAKDFQTLEEAKAHAERLFADHKKAKRKSCACGYMHPKGAPCPDGPTGG